MDYPTVAPKKVLSRVAFPRALALASQCDAGPLGGIPAAPGPTPPAYVLAGAIVHTGAALSSGGYVYETSARNLAPLGLDDKQAVLLDAVCPNSATPYILVYTRAAAGADKGQTPAARTKSIFAAAGGGGGGDDAADAGGGGGGGNNAGVSGGDDYAGAGGGGAGDGDGDGQAAAFPGGRQRQPCCQVQ
jgi:hypothetical protein